MVAGALAALVTTLPALGQDDAPAPGPPPVEEPDPNEGRLIRQIQVVRPVPDGTGTREPVSEEVERLVRNQVRSEEGRPYRHQTVEDDIARLTKLGRFHNVAAFVQDQTDGTVTLAFVVTEQPIIRDVQSVGNRLLSDIEIIEAVNQLVGTPVDRFQLDRACRQIEDLYRRKGYYLATVTVDETALKETGTLILRVREGARIKVTDIRFEGNRSFMARELKQQIRTKRNFPLWETGPLDDDVLAEDVGAIVQFYRDRGYLDVRVDRKYQLSPDNREAIVTFLIEEGPVYTLRGIRVRYRDARTVEQYKTEVLKDPVARVDHLTPEQARQVGAGVFSEDQVLGLMNIKPGGVYGIRDVERGVKAIEEAYGRMGYTDARVDQRREIRSVERPEVDLLLFVVEGDRYLTGEHIIRGNTITRQSVILREIQARPGRPLDESALEESKKRLEQLQIFKTGSISYALQVPDETGSRDVLWEVEETNTGSVTFGVGVSSDSGIIGQLGMRQSNFDLFRPPRSFEEAVTGRGFRGAGQTFSVDLMPGNEQQNYSVSLLEPHLFETDLSGRATGFYATRDYEEYDEERYGGRLGIGRRFGSRLVANLGFRGEWVALSDIEADAPADYFASAERRLVNGLEFRLGRTTTDRLIVPTRGTRMSAAVEQVGLFDDEVSFTRFSADYAAYYTLNETFSGLKTVLSFNVKADWIPQDASEVPVYERFFLGGRTLRGLEFRTVSPRGFQLNGLPAEDPIGGTWSFFAGVELQQPVHEVVALAFFVDTGTVTNDPGFDDYRITAGAGLRLSIPGLTQIPLAFDFAFPIMREDTDEERVFTFTLDIPF